MNEIETISKTTPPLPEAEKKFPEVIMSLRRLEAAKKRYGPLSEIEIEAETWSQAHHELGGWAKDRLHEFMDYKLGKIDDQKLEETFTFSRACGKHLKSKTTDPLIGNSITDYFECLGAWADGAELTVYAQTINDRLKRND